MIPSLVVDDLRAALVEYLASTFALSDDDVRDALSSFLQDPGDGIFRGPFLRVRTPFRGVEPDWVWPLDWRRRDFVPHAHQGRAFERLSTAEGRSPLPTIVTTGTGSGKTECFLYPVLDHCARMKALGHGGVKALVLYPMNALATDQAGRIAALVNSERELAGVTAGLYVGGDGRHNTMGVDHCIDRREALRAEPPDVLLTNYKMLDFLLLRREDRDLWAVNDPSTLAYVVLDEFHTYDGAQGTDVAMLLRRLGRTLGMHTGDRPLGNATPVATSATLGTGPAATEALRGFAGKVFGVEFDSESVIGEHRQTIEEACGPVDYALPIPDVAEVIALPLSEPDAVAAAFTHIVDDSDNHGSDGPTDPVALGVLLRQHPLTRAVLAAVKDRARSWSDAVEEIITRAPNWGAARQRDPDSVERALARYLWLLSLARRQVGTRQMPLFAVEVQLWMREVSRVLRAVDPEPAFHWRDSAEADGETGATSELPAVYCRRCGMSGWMARQAENSRRLEVRPNEIYQASMEHPAQVRVLLRANPADPAARWYDPVNRQLSTSRTDDAVPVLVTANEDDARRDRCPGCLETEAIRFIGLRTASLASVSINTIFASPHVDEHERKLLAFTDSVQDASHRAGFFAGRTHRINLRSLMSRIVSREGSLSLADLGDQLAHEASTTRERFALVPPDLMRHPKVRTVWTDDADPHGLEVLRLRLGFEADLEFGLASRYGRTLELSRVAVAEVTVGDFDCTLDLLTEDLLHRFGDSIGSAVVELPVYLRGLLHRLRMRGGIQHPFLGPYINDGGRLWHLWGGRPDGAPPFPPGQSRPVFFATAPRGDFDSVTASATTPTWLVDWAVRSLSVDRLNAAEVNQRTLAMLAHETDTVVDVSAGAYRAFGIDRHHIRIHDIVDDDEPVPAAMRCDLCAARHPVPAHQIGDWLGTPCLRYGCAGHYLVDPPRPDNYYRRLYREGIIRRVVTGEHTGLLKRQQREDLERAFKQGTEPDAPNVITATPTLEMGIDIGDLSAVSLVGVPRSPASYVQRVGRAGRASGNALITTFVGTDTHGLYYLADPDAMISGEVRPPDCYLDAPDTIERQYIAYLLDRIADLSMEGPAPRRHIGEVMNGAFAPEGLFRRLIDASQQDQSLIETFVQLFGGHLAPRTINHLRHFAVDGIEALLRDGEQRWQIEVKELENRRRRLSKAVDDLVTSSSRTAAQDEDLHDLMGQRRATIQRLRERRDEYTLSGLERLGLLPNYTLMDDGVTLSASMWWRDQAGDYQSETLEYVRSAAMAVQELAPGNTFYAGGHRHLIDALDIGTADEPSYETWRLCPDCGFGQVEAPDDPPPLHCPRCAALGIADMGARHTMLRLRTVFAGSSEEAARVFDEDDDRKRERYALLATVDCEPAGIRDAWRLTRTTFGTELSSATRIRRVNLGYRDRPGESMPIAGAARHVTRFRVCRQCGAVESVRKDRDRDGTQPDRLHQVWCKVRSRAAVPVWDDIVLYHELITEAVRMLLPVSLFEVEERLVSFTGALLLGLREDFGGDPDHLAIVRSEAPNRGGQGTRRFLVLYDTVPGGTGYLDRLGDPERVRSILELARTAISRCPCRNEGRPACHRCLLGVIDRADYDAADARLALELLDGLLEGWASEPVSTVADLDMGAVEESELERRFKVALRDWELKARRQARLRGETDDPVVMRSVPGPKGREALELRFTVDGQLLRYRIDEQEGLGTTPNTIPDFVIRRLDAAGPEVAVYLDGYQFHASPDHNNLLEDAEKRAGVRRSGRLVWNLTWDDVDAFHRAAVSESDAGPALRGLLDTSGRTAARKLHHGRSGVLDRDRADDNPMELLLTYLRHPVAADWERLALSNIAGAVASAATRAELAPHQVPVVLAAAVTGATAEPTDETPPAAVGRTILHATPATNRGLGFHCFLDQPAQDERWTVVISLPDDGKAVGEPMHPGRWHDWLQWANLGQFLAATGRDFVVCTTTTPPDVVADLLLSDLAEHSPDSDRTPGLVSPSATRAPRTATPTLSADMIEELELVDDRAVAALVRRVLEAGGPPFVAGYETDTGDVIEAAWPAKHIGVVPGGDTAGATGTWDVRAAGDWDAGVLLEALVR